MRQLRRPIFTAVHGMAYGGGCEIAISTDFIIASDDAVFGQPEPWSACPPAAAHRSSFPACCRRPKAMQMLMTGEPITAQEAHRLGWSTRSTPRPNS